jgi:hypothetical protein
MKNIEIRSQSASALRFWSIVILVGIVPIFCKAFNQPVHQAIAQSAALSSDGLAKFLTDNLGAQYAPFTVFPTILFDNPDVKDSQSPIAKRKGVSPGYCRILP